ncbi:MAG: iron-sulfur cluster assembly protein [Actinobacteria bacterium]|nr:iron-sulfur cluster assembly protein [Actinomycetota bacterium]
MSLTKQEVLDALSEVYDPEIPINIVDMGLIYKVDIDSNNNIEVDMTMTARGCPMHTLMLKQAKDRLEKIKGAGTVKVNLVWNPPWSPDMISQKIKDQLQKND